jgi:hypothetical protein
MKLTIRHADKDFKSLNAQERHEYRKDIYLADKVKKPLVQILYYLGMAKFYRDGDCLGFLLRWYHPFNIIFVLLAFGVSIFTNSSMQELLKDLFTLPDYWKNKEMEWIG